MSRKYIAKRLRGRVTTTPPQMSLEIEPITTAEGASVRARGGGEAAGAGTVTRGYRQIAASDHMPRLLRRWFPDNGGRQPATHAGPRVGGWIQVTRSNVHEKY
ncbi:hypothetical protein EVAR_38361_1 [Eumeta japonica]|uniref:Uncharacterized protein n=1 Tax=Eumeta variegata TaxID=151549 RepID=A0A4C1XXP5_EUMVA|nr:hypothetical protein EVAR_38361_1 [Eumeta japonica]